MAEYYSPRPSSTTFGERNHRWTSPLTEVPSTQHRAPPKPLTHYANVHRDKDTAITAAYRNGGYSMKAIGDHFGLHYSMISRIIKKAADSKFKVQPDPCRSSALVWQGRGPRQRGKRDGVMYAQGLGTRHDDAKAATWYEKAAVQAFAEAQANLGLAYFGGRRSDAEQQHGVLLVAVGSTCRPGRRRSTWQSAKKHDTRTARRGGSARGGMAAAGVCGK